MNSMTRTLIYVVVAVVTLSLAIWNGMPSAEMNVNVAANVGEKFFPEFTDPTEATGVRVIVFDDETAVIKPFEVSRVGNEWRIPSHYDYPADGAEQLSKTASSLVGVERGAVAGESELDFARLGVVDPLADDKDSLKGRGDRLTLTKGNEALVDLIIGNKVPDKTDQYYVRKPDDKITYITNLKIDLTTKFGDWIEPDLLIIEPASLRELEIHDHSVDVLNGRILAGSDVILTRASDSDPWTMAGLDPAKEELKSSEVNAMVTALDGLKIIGVRPKPEGLRGDLRMTGDVTPSRSTQRELNSRGYYLVPTEDRGLELYSNEGELSAVTNSGVKYVLRFGDLFTGDEFDIEVGSAKSEDEEQTEEPSKPADESGSKKSRYLFVSVQFDPDAIGAIPTKPVPPTESETEASPEPAEGDAAEAETETKEKTDDKQAAYEAALKQYEQEIEAHKTKLEDARKLVDQLNDRFADWYYVIDAASFDRLNKGRADLVEEKAPAEEPTPETSTETKPEMPAPVNSTPVPEETTSTPAPAGTSTKPEMPAPTEATPAPAATTSTPAMPTPAATSTPVPVSTSETIPPAESTSTPAPAKTSSQ